MRQALFFGSFNPLHIGHITIAKYILDNNDADSVSFVLSPHNPLKKTDILADARQRLNRLRYSVHRINECRKKHLKKNELFKPLKVSAIEFKLTEPLYTYNTLKYLQNKYCNDTFILVIGADNCEKLEGWYKWKDLINEFEIWVYPRTGYNAEPICKQYGLKFLNAPIIDISSTEIRNSESIGKEVNGYVKNSYFCTIFEK